MTITATDFDKLIEAIRESSATNDEKIAIFNALSNYITSKP